MVNREVRLDTDLALLDIAQLETTVDARVIIPHENTATAPVGMATWHINVPPQRNDGRNRKPIAYRPQKLATLFHHNRFFVQKKIDGALHADDSEWLPCVAV